MMPSTNAYRRRSATVAGSPIAVSGRLYRNSNQRPRSIPPRTPKNKKSSGLSHPSRRSLMLMATIARANGPTIIQASRPKNAGVDDRACVDMDGPPHRPRAAGLGRRAADVSTEVGKMPRGKLGGSGGGGGSHDGDGQDGA